MSRRPAMTGRSTRFISSDTIERIASEIRINSSDLADRYEVDIVSLAKRLQCDVVFVQFTPSSVSARVTRQTDTDPVRYLIEVNASESPARRRFSIAHELAHVVLHDDGGEFSFTEHRMSLSDYEPDEAYKEVQANMLAAALLMPQALVTAFWRGTPDIDDLARKFGVSRDAAYWRVHNLRLLQDG